MADLFRNFGAPGLYRQIIPIVFLLSAILFWLSLRLVVFSSDKTVQSGSHNDVVHVVRDHSYMYPYRKQMTKQFLMLNPPQVGVNLIISYLHKFHLQPPSTKPYKTEPTKGSEYTNILKQLFGNRTNGFFVEAGANDGQYLSNTLWLEMEQNWTGLLIEPNSFLVPALRLVNRKAWIADVCLSPVPYPIKVRFTHNVGKYDWNNGQGFIEKTAKRDADSRIFAGAVDCFPLATLLAAINQTEVDYFSLDIEGVEYKVLEHFPFDKILIKVMSVEYNLIPEKFPRLKRLLTAAGYEIVFQDGHELFAVHKNYSNVYKLN